MKETQMGVGIKMCLGVDPGTAILYCLISNESFNSFESYGICVLGIRTLFFEEASVANA